MCSLRTCQYALRQKLPEAGFVGLEDILMCCSGRTDLVFFGLSGCTWPTIQDRRHLSLSLQRMLNVAVEGFQIFITAKLCNEFWLNVCFEESSNTGPPNGVIRNLLLVCVIEFGLMHTRFVLGVILFCEPR